MPRLGSGLLPKWFVLPFPAAGQKRLPTGFGANVSVGNRSRYSSRAWLRIQFLPLFIRRAASSSRSFVSLEIRKLEVVEGTSLL